MNPKSTFVGVYLLSFVFCLTSCSGDSDDESNTGSVNQPVNNIQMNSTIYGGGPFYFGGQKVMDELKFSGFTTINFWTIHVESNGDLIYNDQLIVKDGKYVGRPEWPSEIASLKVEPTSINRIQFGVASYGVPDFERIQSLIETEGVSSDSILYRNFAALKSTIPSIDAIDFDDESNYHIESATKFGIMLSDIGYKISFVPYTAKWFWEETFENINAARENAVDRVQIQAYAGGAGNLPSMWNGSFGDSKVSMGLWSFHGSSCNEGQSPEEVEDILKSWKSNISGGFIWLYDDAKKCGGSYLVAQYAAAINTALGINELVLSKAQEPFPQNGDISIATSATLTWAPGFNADKHNIYLSADNQINSEDLISSQAESQLFIDNLSPSTKYYWRVDEMHKDNIIEGDLWSFTTHREGYKAYDRSGTESITVMAKGENAPNEIALKAFDDNVKTKWLDFSATSWLQLEFDEGRQFEITEYTITSANDSPERDPKDWVLKASNDGEVWETIDSRRSQSFDERFEKRRYTFENNKKYGYYRFEITNHGGGITQLAEIELIEYVRE
jgi:hypothetical protein